QLQPPALNHTPSRFRPHQPPRPEKEKTLLPILLLSPCKRYEGQRPWCGRSPPRRPFSKVARHEVGKHGVLQQSLADACHVRDTCEPHVSSNAPAHHCAHMRHCLGLALKSPCSPFKRWHPERGLASRISYSHT